MAKKMPVNIIKRVINTKNKPSFPRVSTFAKYAEVEYPKIIAEIETHNIAKYNAIDFIINLPFLIFKFIVFNPFSKQRPILKVKYERKTHIFQKQRPQVSKEKQFIFPKIILSIHVL